MTDALTKIDDKLCRVYATFAKGEMSWKVVSYPCSYNEKTRCYQLEGKLRKQEGNGEIFKSFVDSKPYVGGSSDFGHLISPNATITGHDWCFESDLETTKATIRQMMVDKLKVIQEQCQQVISQIEASE